MPVKQEQKVHVVVSSNLLQCCVCTNYVLYFSEQRWQNSTTHSGKNLHSWTCWNEGSAVMLLSLCLVWSACLSYSYQSFLIDTVNTGSVVKDSQAQVQEQGSEI